MAISFQKLFIFLKSRGYNKSYLRDNGIHPAIISKLAKGSLSKESRVDTITIDKLCELLDCQPADIMEYVKDKETKN